MLMSKSKLNKRIPQQYYVKSKLARKMKIGKTISVFFFPKGVCHRNSNLKAHLWNFEPWFVPTYHDHLLLLEVGTKKGIKGIK